MNPDGFGQARLTNNAATDHGPSWSPEGTKIASQSDRDGNSEIYVMNTDGSGQTRIKNKSSDEFWPSWLLDSTKITFETTRYGLEEIYATNADESLQTNLITNSVSDNWPVWRQEPALALAATPVLVYLDFNPRFHSESQILGYG